MANLKSHFILVHGACHGAWCWYKLETLLKSGGFRVTSLDMGASGIDPRRIDDLKSISDYSMPVMDLLASLPPEEKVMLVGHSYGGAVLSFAMESFPHKISVAVFVTAFMPGPDISLQSHFQEYVRRPEYQIARHYFISNGADSSWIFEKEALASTAYELCPSEVLTLANTLVRPMYLLADDKVSKDVVVSKEKYGSVRRVYIISKEDQLIKDDFQRYMIECTPPDEVMEINGSDHMIMLSKPQELFACLQRIFESYS